MGVSEMIGLVRARKEFGPKWHYENRAGKQIKMPGLSDLQIAALACVRDDTVTRYEKRVGYERYVAYRAEGFDVTCQIYALKKRRLIYFRSDGSRLFRLSSFAMDVLAKYSEY
jgi:hypothetical protein